MSEYSDLKQSINELKASGENNAKKLDRILSWAEGDKELGTPSVKQLIDENRKGISEVLKRTYENEDLIKDTQKDVQSVTKDVQNIKKQSAAIGMGGGGIIFTLLETIKQWAGL